MILLFMSIWAIVIALNEVLFAAQPFTLASIAATLPHTLMFTVVMSAAVYLAKEKINDAISKGRPIDKRFVAELTPQVSHELNNVRRRMDALDKNQKKGRRSKAKKIKLDPLDPISTHEALEREREQNNNALERLHYDTERELEQYDHSKDKAKSLNTNTTEDTKRAAAKIATNAANVAAEAVAAMSADLEPVKEDTLEMLRNAQVQAESRAKDRNHLKAMALARAEEKTRQARELAKSGPKQSLVEPKSPVIPTRQMSVEERNAQIAKARAKLKERRKAQIEALSAVSQEDRASQQKAALAAALERKREAEKKKAKPLTAQEQAKARIQAVIRAKHVQDGEASASDSKLATSYAPNSSVAKKMNETAQRVAQIQAELANRKQQQLEAMEKAKEAREAEKSEAKNSQAAQSASTAAANPDASKQDHTKPKIEGLKQGAGVELAEQVGLASGAGIEVTNGDYNKNADSIDSVDSNEQNKIHGEERLDTSALKKVQAPKQGAGLDTSALKKATLGKDKDTEDGVMSAEERKQLAESARAKLLKLQQSGQLPMEPMGGGSLDVSALAAAAAQVGSMEIDPNSVSTELSTPVRSGTSSNEGLTSEDVEQAALNNAIAAQLAAAGGRPVATKAAKLDLASSQANVRASALGRAQMPKASQQAISAAKQQKPHGAKDSPKSSGSAAANMLKNDSTPAPRATNEQIQASLRQTARALAPGRDHKVDLTPRGGPQLPKTLKQEELVQTAPRMQSRRTISAKAKERVLKPQNKAEAQVNAARQATLGAGVRPKDISEKADFSALATKAGQAQAKAHAAAYSQVQVAQNPNAAKVEAVLAAKAAREKAAKAKGE